MKLTTKEDLLIQEYLSKNNVTNCKTYYPPKQGKGTDTKDTLGYQITTIATPSIKEDKEGNIIGLEYKSSWADAMDLKSSLNHKDMLPILKNTVWFKLRLKLEVLKDKKNKRQIRRDIKRLNNITSKNGKVTKYKKRELPVPPSKRVVED